MSFFFDVWTLEGFVLASDVRLIGTGRRSYAHKLRGSPYNETSCAIAVCGDYCEASLNFFTQATSRRDTLREVAYDFARAWTERFAGTEEYSAVHLVGFERIPETDEFVPQMWFWSNWAGERYLTKEELNGQFKSFSDPIPFNNHIPQKIKQLTGKFPAGSYTEERSLVTSFLALYQPYFIWNGDTHFWRSAAHAVGSAMNLLWREKTNWSIDETWRLAEMCLQFLAKVGSFMPESTVGLSPEGACDVLAVTPTGTERKVWSDLPNPD